MYDTRGHGLSDLVIEEGEIYGHLAADLARLVQKLGLDKPRLIGHSLGAATVAVAAAAYPDLAHCVILEDPPWRPPADETNQETIAAMHEWRTNLEAHKSKTADELADLCRQENPLWSEDECRPWAASKLQLNLGVFGFFGTPPERWQDVVSRIACPILLITADPERGAIVTPEIAQEAAGLWRNGRIAHLAGAGHSIRRDQFAAYVKQVTTFLAQT